MEIKEIILWAIGILVASQLGIGISVLINTIKSANKLDGISQDIKTLIGMIPGLTPVSKIRNLFIGGKKEFKEYIKECLKKLPKAVKSNTVLLEIIDEFNALADKIVESEECLYEEYIKLKNLKQKIEHHLVRRHKSKFKVWADKLEDFALGLLIKRYI